MSDEDFESYEIICKNDMLYYNLEGTDYGNANVEPFFLPLVLVCLHLPLHEYATA
jgi:hypothetical protein